MTASPRQTVCTIRLRAPNLSQIAEFAERKRMKRSEVLRQANVRLVADFGVSSRASLPVVLTGIAK